MNQHRLLLFWCYRDLVGCHIKLRMADNTPHNPQGYGYLRIPVSTVLGYLEVKCYWTLSMPASILSPYAISMQYDCHGYSDWNDFNGTGCLVHLS